MHRSSEPIGVIAAALASARRPPASVTEPSAMRLWPVGSTLSARAWASTRSPPCRPPRSTRILAKSDWTTRLAHASVEWISSDWPVCPISETATPHRAGAALSYARRYAVLRWSGSPARTISMRPTSSQSPPRRLQWVRAAANRPIDPKPLLAAEPSAALRDQLIAEIAGLRTAHRRLPAQKHAHEG
jgi:hypothetical protein